MTETESLIAEVRLLRADVARLHAAHTAVHIRHGWMSLLLLRLLFHSDAGALTMETTDQSYDLNTSHMTGRFELCC